MWDRLAELQIDKVAARKDIPTKKLEDEDIAGDLSDRLRWELGGILERWESDRSEEEDQKQKRPLLNSSEWVAIEASYECNCAWGNCKMAELEGQNHRGSMELVGSFESIPSAPTADG